MNQLLLVCVVRSASHSRWCDALSDGKDEEKLFENIDMLDSLAISCAT